MEDATYLLMFEMFKSQCTYLYEEWETAEDLGVQVLRFYKPEKNKEEIKHNVEEQQGVWEGVEPHPTKEGVYVIPMLLKKDRNGREALTMMTSLGKKKRWISIDQFEPKDIEFDVETGVTTIVISSAPASHMGLIRDERNPVHNDRLNAIKLQQLQEGMRCKFGRCHKLFKPLSNFYPPSATIDELRFCDAICDQQYDQVIAEVSRLITSLTQSPHYFSSILSYNITHREGGDSPSSFGNFSNLLFFWRILTG